MGIINANSTIWYLLLLPYSFTISINWFLVSNFHLSSQQCLCPKQLITPTSYFILSFNRCTWVTLPVDRILQKLCIVHSWCWLKRQMQTNKNRIISRFSRGLVLTMTMDNGCSIQMKNSDWGVCSISCKRHCTLHKISRSCVVSQVLLR